MAIPEDVRVYEISTASVSSDLNNQEIAFENVNDADLGWKMFGGKNASGETTLFLGKDKASRVSTLVATGDVTIVSGTITIDSLSLTTAANYQVMYGDFAQTTTFKWEGSKLRIGSTATPDYLVDVESTLQDHMRLENTNANATSPILMLKKTSVSPANDDGCGLISFTGTNDDLSVPEINYVTIEATAADVSSNSTDGSLFIKTMVAGVQDDTFTLKGGNVSVGKVGTCKFEVSGGGSRTAGDFCVDTANKIIYVGALSSSGGDTLSNFIIRDRNGTEHLNYSTSGLSLSLPISTANFAIGLSTAQNKIHGHIASASSCFLQTTNSTSGSTATDGFKVGIDSGGNANVWNYENTNMYLVTNSLVRQVITNGGIVGIGDDTTPTAAKFVIKNIAGTTPAMVITDSSSNEIFKIWDTGHISNVDGINTTSASKGSGISTHNYGEGAPDHTNGVGSYDHTGGTYEQLFTKTSGDNFTQNDADTGAFIVMIGGADNGAAAEIKTYIDGDNVTVFGFNWTDDLASQTFYIFKHPTFVTEDGNITEVSAGSTGKFEVIGYQFTGEYVQGIELKSASDDTNALLVKVEANGYNLNDAMHINYITGSSQPNDHLHCTHIVVDETEATSADATTEIELIRMDTTSSSDMKKTGLSIGGGFDTALNVAGSPAIDPTVGYTVLSSSVVDRVNSGGGGNDAFVNVAVDQALFAAVNDYFLVGGTGEVIPFEVISIVLETNGSQNSTLEFYYSTVGDTWTQVFPSDGTNGLQNSGNISFADPGDWVTTDTAESSADITEAYYIKIVRTKLGTYTQPIEDYIKTFVSRDTGMLIRGDGTISPADLTDADAPNDSIYFSTTQQKLAYKRNSTVYDLHA